MNFNLLVSPNNTSYQTLELFEQQDLSYDASFYDDVDIDKIKVPFYTSIRIPLTDNNKSVLGYDPLNDDIANYPNDDYYFIIELQDANNTELRGMLTFTAIEYNSDEPYLEVELKDFLTIFFSTIKDKGIGDVLTSSYHTSRHTMEDFFDTTANGGEAGTIGTNPDYSRIVNFPYIDFANDTEKYGYEERQFTEYGAGTDRVGLVPTLSVKKYIEQIGTYLSGQFGTVTIKSKLFGINETEAISDLEPEKLQAVIPAKLLAKSDTNTRQFQITQAPSRAYPNEDLDLQTNLNGNNKIVRTVHLGSGESFGNYGSTGYSMQKFGIKQQSTGSIPTYDQDQEAYISERGYFCPHMSFKAKVQFLSGDRSENTGVISYDIPVIGEDKMVYRINTASSTMTFGLYYIIYEDGYPKKKIRLVDTNGSPIVLNASNATAVRGASAKANGEYFETGFVDPVATSVKVRINTLVFPGIKDQLQFSAVDAYMPSDEQIQLDVYGESRYGSSIVLEPINGNLNVQYVSAISGMPINDGNHLVDYASSMSTQNFGASSIRKARTFLASYSDFNILVKATEDFNPYFLSDEFIIKDSLNNSTELTPADVIKNIAKRFGCALIYEWDGSGHVLRVDPLHLLRESVVSGDYYLDDSVSIKISRPTDLAKNIVLNNKEDGLFYDTKTVTSNEITGSTKQLLNAQGIVDLEYNFETAVYYKSLCGETFVQGDTQNLQWNIITHKENGTVINVFGKYNEFSMRFAYLIAPNYGTEIVSPYSINQELRPNLFTTTQRIYVPMYDFDTGDVSDRHIFNGRLTHKNASGFDLLFENELEQTTDMYDYFITLEQVKSKGAASVEFSMVLPTQNLSSVIFMLDKYTFGLMNGQSVLIKEVTGDVYDENAYLTVKGLIE
jgi:hypothetical protein